MAINTVYQPPAGMMGEYAYQTSAVRQVRQNLDESIGRNMQAQQFNANQRQQYARMEQQGQQFNANSQQNQQQFDANRFDRLQQQQFANTQSAFAEYNKSRSDYDDVIQDGVKNGWLKIAPEDKQKLRQLSASDSEVMQRDDLDEMTKVRMLTAIQQSRRNIIPSIVPGFDRPSKTFEMAEQNTFVIGPDGVARALVAGQRLGPNDSLFFMGKRSGEMNPVPMERQQPEKAAKPVSDKYWSPELDYSAKYAKSVEQLNEMRKGTIDGYKSQFDEAAAILKEQQMSGIPGGKLEVAGPDIQPLNGKLRMVGERIYDLKDPKERLTYQSAIRLLNTPGVAYSREDVLKQIQQNDEDHSMGQAGDFGQQQPTQEQPQAPQAGPPDPAQVEEMLKDQPPGIYTVGGYRFQKE